MKLLVKYMKPHFKFMLIGLIIKIIGTLTDLLIPYILEHLIDNIVPIGNMKTIVAWGLVMILCAIIGLTGNIVANRRASAVARDVTRDIRHDLFKRISYLSARQIDEISVPTLETRLTSDTYNLHHMIGMMQRLGVRAPILLIGGIIVTLSMDVKLALILISVLPLITAAVLIISNKGIPLFKEQQNKTDDMVRVVRENAQGIRVIKALSKTEYEIDKFREANDNVTNAEKKSGRLMAATNPLMSAFLNIGMAFVILVGAYGVNGGEIKAGMIISFMSYFTIILNAMLSITRMFTLFSKGAASADRISEVLAYPSDLDVQASKGKADTDGFIVFENVSFAYPKHNATLSDIDFTVKKGQTVGIIGATGSGKSTVIKLLQRFYDVDSGRILIDGEDIRCIEPSELRLMMGTVLQNDFLFSGTVRENIDFYRDLSIEDIQSAIRMAQVEEFISSLDEGLDYHINSKGTNVSGGQKQRILIARALAAKPQILILDDSSSALDYKTDSRLRTAIRENFADTTKFIIAQRVSSIAHSDLILVLDRGMIVGKGTHSELIESCPIYREISDSQIGGVVQ